MPDSKRNKYTSGNKQEGKQCQYCSVFMNHGHQPCKYCSVYLQRREYIAVLGLEGENFSLGESLAVFDHVLRKIMQQYHQTGSNWKQIESVMIMMVQEQIRLMTERQADQQTF